MFRTHTGEQIREDEEGLLLQEARAFAAEPCRALAQATANGEVPFAEHVSEGQKEATRLRNLREAEEIESGKKDSSFYVWQRMNFFITGECIAFLPK